MVKLPTLEGKPNFNFNLPNLVDSMPFHTPIYHKGLYQILIMLIFWIKELYLMIIQPNNEAMRKNDG
jgi:hypothetical protein